MWDELAEKPQSVSAVPSGCWISSAPTVQPQAAELPHELVTWGWDWIPNAGYPEQI